MISFRAQFDQRSPLDEIVKEGARRMLQTAIDAEAFITMHSDRTDQRGRRLVVRNRSLPDREIPTCAGAIPVTQGRVGDNGPDRGNQVTFSPSVLPSYPRKTKAIEELIPWLYLKEISTGDFGEALQSLMGERAAGLSVYVVCRLKEQWCSEYDDRSKCDLSEKHYVYVWADGIHAEVWLEDDPNKKQCLLVLMGAKPDGRKELIAVGLFTACRLAPSFQTRRKEFPAE